MALKLVIATGSTVIIEKPDLLVSWYNGSTDGLRNVRHGPEYYSNTAVATGTHNEVGLADLPWAVLLDGQPRGDAALHLLQLPPVSLMAVPAQPLHTLNTPNNIPSISSALAAICGRGVGCPIASKMAHPKRRASIPVLDNRAIFATFDSDSWQPWDQKLKQVATVKSQSRIERALLIVHRAVSEPANQRDWTALEANWPQYTRIQLFDQCWWALLGKHGPDLRIAAGVTPP
jgi:hypothetical protein